MSQERQWVWYLAPLETPSAFASPGWDAWGTQEVLVWYLLMVHDSEFSLAAFQQILFSLGLKDPAWGTWASQTPLSTKITPGGN